MSAVGHLVTAMRSAGRSVRRLDPEVFPHSCKHKSGLLNDQ